MPLYEFVCPTCGSRAELFVRTVSNTAAPPACKNKGCSTAMQRVPSVFARHLTLKDKVVEAEAKFGKEVDAAMGAEMDLSKYTNRYEQAAKDLPPPDVP